MRASIATVALLSCLLVPTKIDAAVPLLLAYPAIVPIGNALMASVTALFVAKQISDQSYRNARQRISEALSAGSEEDLRATAETVTVLLNRSHAAGVIGRDRNCPLTNGQVRRREGPDGECPPERRSSPQLCCPEFMTLHRSQGRLIKVNNFAYSVVDPRRGHELCCLEWDGLHGRFEIFRGYNGTGSHAIPNQRGRTRGPTRFVHDGERACATPSDLTLPEVCATTHPEKADPTGRHFPRQGCFR